MEAVAKALESDDRLCFLVAQRDASADDPTPQQFYRAGTIGMIMRMRKLSEGGLKVLVQGLCRARIQRFVSDSPCYRVRMERSEDKVLGRSLNVEALLRSVRQNIDKLSGLGKTIQPELSMVVQSVDDPGRMADLVASNLTLKVPEAQELLELDEPVQRLTRINQTIEKEIGILEVQSQIQNRAREEMSKTQRDYYLREQLRQIKNELGDGDVHGEEMEELRAKIGRAGLPDEARVEAEKQVRRLDQMHAESAEAGVLRTYIEWLTELPVERRQRGHAGHRQRAADPRRRPLRPRAHQGTHPRLPGGAQAARRRARPDPVPAGAARRGQDVAGAIDRARDGTQVRAHGAGRRTRRGGDPRAPPHVCRARCPGASSSR
jgi:ATP-dependent Lon protease